MRRPRGRACFPRLVAVRALQHKSLFAKCLSSRDQTRHRRTKVPDEKKELLAGGCGDRGGDARVHFWMDGRVLAWLPRGIRPHGVGVDRALECRTCSAQQEAIQQQYTYSCSRPVLLLWSNCMKRESMMQGIMRPSRAGRGLAQSG
jgi:hypothetical protein